MRDEFKHDGQERKKAKTRPQAGVHSLQLAATRIVVYGILYGGVYYTYIT